MADMMNFPGAATEGSSPNAPTDITQFIGATPEKGVSGPGSGEVAGPIFSNDDIIKQYQRAVDAVSHSATMSIQPYQSPDTEKYIQSLKTLRVLHDGNLADIQVQRELFNSATEEERKAIQAKATADIQRENADQARAQQVSDIAYGLNHQNGVGGNADRLAEKNVLFRQLNDQAIQLKAHVAENAAALEEETSVNFTEDPIRWLEGIFKIPQLTDQVEAGQKRIAIADNTIKGVADDINETLAANTAAIEARSKELPLLTAQQAAATNAATVALATEKAAKANQDLARQNSTFAGLNFSEALAANSAEHGAQTLAQEAAMNKFRAGMQEVIKSTTDAEAQIKLTGLMEGLQDRNSIESMLRAYETRRGLPKNSVTYTQYMRSNDKAKNYYVAGAIGFAGVNAGDAYYNYIDAEERNQPLGPFVSEQTSKMLKDIHRFAESLPGDGNLSPTFAGKNKEEKRDIIKTMITARFANMAKDPTVNPQENPFYEVKPSTVALQFQGFAKTPQGRLLEQMIKAPTPPVTADVVATLAAGAPDPQAAARSISQYYQLNMQVRNSVTDFQSMGIKPPVQYNWRADLGGSVFKGQRIVDLTNETQVLHYLQEKEMSRRLSEESIKGLVGVPQ